MTAGLGVIDCSCPEIVWKQVGNDLLMTLGALKETRSILFKTVLRVKPINQ